MIQTHGFSYIGQHACRFAVALVVLSLTGCHQGAYKATNLPAQFQAPTIRSAQRLNLSQLARTHAGSDIIQPGDLLGIAIATGLDHEPASPRLLRVAEDGTVNVPLIGPVPVAGLEMPMAELAVRETGIRRDVYRECQVSVQMESRLTNQVTVLGAVENPGTYLLPKAESDLLAALVAAGGVLEEANTVLEIRNPSGVGMAVANHQPGDYGALPVNYRPPGTVVGRQQLVQVDLLNTNAASNDQLRVYDGTVIMVPPRLPQTIHVMGLVSKAGQYEINSDREVRLLDAIAMAGGRRMEVADKVRIIRQVPQSTPITITASIREAQRNGAANLRLSGGDMVHVEETPLTFTLETLRSFFRLGVATGITGLQADHAKSFHRDRAI